MNSSKLALRPATLTPDGAGPAARAPLPLRHITTSRLLPVTVTLPHSRGGAGHGRLRLPQQRHKGQVQHPLLLLWGGRERWRWWWWGG